MRQRHFILTAMAAAAMLLPTDALAQRLVILHTNDTHSQIDPTDKGVGGVARRKVVIDSVRAAEPNVLVVDAGDAVQGTMYFNLYKGEVEHKVLNALGYDYAILGNHDFDNAVHSLAENLKHSNVKWLATNYDLRSGELAPFFAPYAIREVDGKRVGIIALNLQPKGMISEGNYDGVVYEDVIKAANATAWNLKHNEYVDAVVAMTHIGYDGVPAPRDVDVAAQSEDIDVIIGGHSHDRIIPGSGREYVNNLNGRPVLVTQTGKRGEVVGKIVLDLADGATEYSLIPIDSRLDGRTDPEFEAMLKPYRHGVDSLMAVKIGRTKRELAESDPALLNFLSDFALQKGRELAGTVDLAIMNKGGIRRGLPKGDITKGMILTMQPFANHIVVVELTGRDLMEALDVMASRGGDGVSEGVDVTFDPATGKVVKATINGRPVSPDVTYRVATIDYLANGGDYMAPLTRGARVAESPEAIADDLLLYFAKLKNKPINPPSPQRMHR